ncbi:MAG: cobyrinate a,c-diamide synthase [Candidatus Magnetominusculus sp. LBB02]|nr:cobyrinate a,c-diamide synthase [Candidatus Magnetominusculus sp. LBB02]
MTSAFVISALQSGAGKTTAALALMAALTRDGRRVQPFKTGPDFIDPGLHRALTGVTSWNLDRWMCGDDYVRRIFAEKSQGADVCIIEGAMGLFDGGNASTAETAKMLGLPVVVMLDVRGTAETAAALVKGIDAFDPGLKLAGVILNRIGSHRHFTRVKEAIEAHSACRVLGSIGVDTEIQIPERHLGLFTAEDGVISTDFTQIISEAAHKGIQTGKLLAATAVDISLIDIPAYMPVPPLNAPSIAVARDSAFCFYYEDNLDFLRRQGALVRFFSPLNDDKIPDGVRAVYLGGGYPELYAERLASNSSMLRSIRDFAEVGGAVYGECGGFMYLTEGIRDLDGRLFPMAGVFPVKSMMGKKRAGLGYREAVLTDDSILGEKGDIARGHEFHYSSIEEMPPAVQTIYECREGTLGYRIKNCTAGYIHLHFASSPNIARSFYLTAATGVTA